MFCAGFGTRFANTRIATSDNGERRYVDPMPKYHGLCETCDFDPTCMLRRSDKLEIIQCEEFSNQQATPKRKPAAKRALPPDSMETAFMGLCANCLNVMTCGFPGARKGVMHCEEYALDEAGLVLSSQTDFSKSAA